MVERDNIINGMDNNPFSESMVARGRIMSATEARSRENTFQQNFNEMDQEMPQYSLENSRPGG